MPSARDKDPMPNDIREDSGPTSLLTPASDTQRRLVNAVGGDYEIRRLLGEGGFAEVYLAWEHTLKREVAIKALRAEHNDSAEVISRFRGEAEAIARLRHPHIVPIYSVAQRDGIAWFVMPRVAGVSLADLLATEERWSFAEVSRILRESASALSAAHAAGIIHRDVKPENIMLDGTDRRVMLMDFGIAKSVGARLPDSRTATGMIIGTPQYMSPEQILGEANVGPASDQYSLGLVAYRMLAGVPAFQANSLPALMLQQTTEYPRPLRELRPDVPIGLANVIERALAKVPADRFASMEEFIEALARVGQDVAGEFRRGRRVAPLSERWDDAVRAVRERRRVAIVILSVGALLAVTTMQYARSSAMQDVLRRRDDAGARARLTAEDFGFPGSPRLMLSWEGSVYDALQRSVARDSADRLAADVYNVWRWDAGFGDPVGAAPGSLVVGYSGGASRQRLVLLSVRRTPAMLSTSISAHAARTIADSMLHAQGEDPAALEFRGVASTQFPAYSEHAFSWRDPKRTIVVGKDTIALGYVVRVIGQSVAAFARLGRVTGAVDTVSTWRGAMLVLFPILLVALGLLISLLATRRSAGDVLQWRMALRLTLPVLALWVTIYSIGMHAAAPSIDGLTQALEIELPAELCAWLLAASTLVVAESMLYDTRPHLTAGLQDLAYGNLRFPELAPAALTGYALGVLAFGVLSAVLAVVHRVAGVPYGAQPLLTLAFMHPVPALVPLLPIGIAIPISALALFAGAFVQRRRWGTALVSVSSSVFIVALLFGWVPNDQVIAIAIIVGMLPAVALRSGYLVMVIAISTALGLPIALEMIVVGGPFRWPGLIGLAILAAPGVLGWWTFRSRPRRIGDVPI